MKSALRFYTLPAIAAAYASLTFCAKPTHTISVVTPILPEQAVVADTDMDEEEREFQEDVNNLFPGEPLPIDTAGWCTKKINGAWFDYRLLADTIRIPLVDGTNNQHFTFPFKNYVTSPFGPRRGFWHFGVDIKLSTGDTVRCAFDGIVRIVQNDRYGYGKVVVLRHQNGLETLYGHLSRSLVSVGEPVKSGTPVGLGGNTGRSTGSHLHFETRYCGEPFDPNVILDFERFTLAGDTLALSKAHFDYLTEIRKTVYHTVRKGETLSHIARRYGTSVQRLCALNNISPKKILSIGKKIVVRKSIDADPVSAGAINPKGLMQDKVEGKSGNDLSAEL